jgi:hypothetical protein
MDEAVRDDDDTSPASSAEELAVSLSERVRQTMAAAEAAAARVRADAAAEAERRAAQIREAAEQDAERLLRRAEREARDYLDDAERRIEAFAQERAQRIGATADRLLAEAETLAGGTERARHLRSALEDVVAALAAAAEAVLAEAAHGRFELPALRDAGAVVTRLTTRPHAVPDPEPPEPDPPPPPAPPADDAREHVRQIASALPRRPGARPRPPQPPAGDDAA